MSDLIATVVLAAGASTRLGRPKQLVMLSGVPLVRRAADVAVSQSFGPVYVVLGAAADEIAPALEGCPVEVLHNSDWRSGMSSSIRTGIAAAVRSGCDAALIMLVDQYRVTAAMLAQLVDVLAHSNASAVCISHDGVLSAPAIFRRELFPDLLRLSGDQGARALLVRLSGQHQIEIVSLPDGAGDLDTKQQLDAFSDDA